MKQRIFPGILLTVGVVMTAVACYLVPDDIVFALTLYLWGVPIAAVGLFRMVFIRKVKSCFHYSTTLGSMLASAVAGCAVMFFLLSIAPFCLDGPSFRDPFAERGFVISFVLFFPVLVLYGFLRYRRKSALGFWMDVVRGVIFGPAMVYTSFWLAEFVRELLKMR